MLGSELSLTPGLLPVACADDQVAVVLEQDLNTTTLVALCLGFAKVVSDKSERRHERSRTEGGSSAAGRPKHERKLSDTKMPGSPRVPSALSPTSSSSSTPTDKKGASKAEGEEGRKPPSGPRSSQKASHKGDHEEDPDAEERYQNHHQGLIKMADARLTIFIFRRAKRQQLSGAGGKAKYDSPQHKRNPQGGSRRPNKGGGRRSDDHEGSPSHHE